MLLTALTKSTDEYLKALLYKISAYQINVTTCSYFTVKNKEWPLLKGASGYIQPLMIIYDPVLKTSSSRCLQTPTDESFNSSNRG